MTFAHYSANRDIDRLTRELVQNGRIYRRGRKHGVLMRPGYGRVVVPGTPSDARAFENFRSEVRRAHSRRYERTTQFVTTD